MSPNRNFDEATIYRDFIDEYMATHRAPTFEGAYQYVVEKCDERSIASPHTSTIRRLLVKRGYKMQLVRQ